MKSLFIFAGEASGDLHGASVLKALHTSAPNLKVMGVGGPKMRAQGLDPLLPMEAFQVMGFIDVFISLPRLICYFNTLCRAILEKKPDTVLLIDYPGFNLRLAKKLRKQGFKGKICQYICPTVWAWKKNRIQQMAKTLDLLLVILPFEPPLFAHTPLRTYYVGHPLIHTLQKHIYNTLKTHPEKVLISIFPGSRKKELIRNLPVQLACAEKLYKQNPNLIFGISLGHNDSLAFIDKLVDKQYKHLRPALFYTNQSYDLMQASYAALAKSGTVTLELALHGIPTVVTYGLSKLDAWLAQHVFRINLPQYCIVNILSQKIVFPEFIGPHLDSNAIFHALNSFIINQEKHKACSQELLLLKQKLGETQADLEVANHLCTSL